MTGRSARSAGLFCLAAMAVLLGCADRPSGSTTGADAPSTWTVDATPLRVIGEDGGVAFEIVRGVDLLADGTVLIVDIRAPAIWLFPIDGGDPVAVGRKGDGPGEYRRPQLLNLLPDGGFAIYDGNERRVTTYGPDGAFRTAFPFLATGRDSMNVLPNRLLPDGDMLATRHGWPRPTADGPLPMPADVVRLDSTGTLVARYGTFEYADLLSLTYEGVPSIFPRWFGWTLVSSFSDQYVAAGENHDYTIAIFDLSGSLVGSIRQEPRAVPVTVAQRDSIVALMKTTPNPPAITNPETFSNTLPEFRGILVDSEGFIWVTPYQVGSASTDTVAIFTPDGGRAATIVIPAGLRIGAIGDTTLIGIATDSNDVESVHVLRLRRGEKALQ